MAARTMDLLRSTPVRQALGIVALMAVISVSTTGVAYLRIREGLEETILASLDQSVASFSTARTAADLRGQVAAEAAVADAELRIIVLISSDGQMVGNAVARLENGVPEVLPLSEDRQLSDHGYEFQVIADGRGTLILGESREAIDEMGEVFAFLIGLSVLPTLILSLAAALVIASRSARRVVSIEDTLARLTKGDLQARVAENPARQDDLSRIAGGLDRMAQAQEQSVAALKQVSADIAHDLKTPIQRIAVLMADLRDRVVDGSPEADLAERAVAESDRAVGVFQSLLQIAQIEGGSPKARFRPVDLAGVIATFADIYGPAAEDGGHKLMVDLPSDQPVLVQGDKDLLGQVVANLIENALRHTPGGSTILLAISETGDKATLSVTDNGPGIPLAERDLVLRRLYRLERSRTTPGNGLGLALVAAVADLHDATLALSGAAPGLAVTLTFAKTTPPPI
ncbi:MAG: ATP-binding protein [Gemmobacter sp.]